MIRFGLSTALRRGFLVSAYTTALPCPTPITPYASLWVGLFFWFAGSLTKLQLKTGAGRERSGSLLGQRGLTSGWRCAFDLLGYLLAPVFFSFLFFVSCLSLYAPLSASIRLFLCGYSTYMSHDVHVTNVGAVALRPRV